MPARRGVYPAMAQHNPPRRLLASIHDVSPRFEGEVDALADRLGWAGVARPALLVVPDFWREAPIRAGTPFAARLRRWAEAGAEIFLHGAVHRDESAHRAGLARFKARHLTAGEGEFLGLDAAEARARLRDGRRLLEDITGRAIAGFVAPAWLYGPGAHEAMADEGIALAEDHWRVWSPANGATLARGPVITWATRSRARELSSLAVATLARTLPGPRVMRLAVHPNDTRSGAVLLSIAATTAALANGRAVSRYADLAADRRPAPALALSA